MTKVVGYCKESLLRESSARQNEAILAIRDNQSIQDLERLLWLAGGLAKLRPLLKVLGKSDDEFTKFLDSVPDLRRQVESLASLPDEFNSFFRSRGWVAFGEINHEVARKAIELARQGDISAGEDVLVSYFGRETIEFGLRGLWRINSFRRRRKLIAAAIDDHCEGRYHSSVLVVLTQLDGIAHDLTHGTIYSRNPERLAKFIFPDSIAGHEEGLAELIATVVGIERNQTTTEKQSAPYRHGILHGRDIGYANELVSAKCFSILLAFGDIAREIETSRLKQLSLVKLEESESPDWRTVWKQLKELNERRERTFLTFPHSIAEMKDSCPVGDVNSDGLWIPGFKAKSLAGKLQYLGFEWKPPEQGQRMVYWVGTWNSPIADYRIAMMGLDDRHIRSIDATIFSYGNQLVDSPAISFLGFIATIPFDTAVPTSSRKWVVDQLNQSDSAGSLQHSSTVLGGVRFELFGKDRFRTLQIHSLNPEPFLDPEAP